MVDVFYQKVREDELLAPIFNFRLSTHWEPHLEKMYTFWNAALFGVKGYNGNPFIKHATMELGEEHFERWMNLFSETVDTRILRACGSRCQDKGRHNGKYVHA
jgi:hemoglobin